MCVVRVKKAKFEPHDSRRGFLNIRTETLFIGSEENNLEMKIKHCFNCYFCGTFSYIFFHKDHSFVYLRVFSRYF